MNKLFKFALAALPMLMLVSCANDDALGVEDNVAQKTETRYLYVTLSSPAASPVSRADAGANAAEWTDDNTDGSTSVVGGKGYYADGTEAENKIRTLDFYFYTRNKQYHSYVSMTIPNAPVNPEDNPRTDNPNIGGFYHCNVPIELTQGQALPTYVICIINAVEGTAYQGSTMEDAQKKILTRLYAAENDADASGKNGKDYFGMSNSVYYGEDPVTGDNGVLIMAAPFTTDKLLTETQVVTLEQQAGDPNSTNRNEIEKFTINIPVERYAAKVKLDLSSLTTPENMPDYPAFLSEVATNAEGQKESTQIALKFTPMRWGANATEGSFYFLKSFRVPAKLDGTNPEGIGDTYATEAELNGLLFPGWNNAAHKRCFWARTPGYYKDEYPLTTDDIKDGKFNYDLIYKSWNDCAEVGDIAKERAEYVMETTMKKSRLTGEGLDDMYLPTASLPAVILLGQYQVGNATVGTDFYIYGRGINGKPVIYSGSAEPITGTKNIREQMFVDQTIVLRENESGTKVAVSSESVLDGDGKASFTLEHPKKAVREYAVNTSSISANALHVAADVVVLQLTKAPTTTTLYFYNPNAGEYQPITEANLTHVNHLLLQNLGGAHFYKDGMAYFTAPIQHWGWYRSDNFNTTPVEYEEVQPDGGKVTKTRARTWAEWDWGQMKTGDFGVVRNHVYTMKIGSIKGLGTAISDPDDPIVPPADKVDYMVHFHVNIQRWAVLPTQEWNW